MIEMLWKQLHIYSDINSEEELVEGEEAFFDVY